MKIERTRLFDSVQRCAPLAVIALGLLVALAACNNGGSGEEPATESTPIKVGVLAPFNTAPGEGIRNGVTLAVEEINEAGGVDGRLIELVEFNTEYSADKAVRGYQRLAGKDEVVAVLGVAGDGIFPIMEQLERYKVPVITTGTGADKLTEMVAENPERYGWFFRVMHKSSELADVTTDFALNCLHEQHGIDRFAIMVEDDIWTSYMRDVWTEKIGGNEGTEIVFSGTFSSQTTDFSILLQQAVEADAQYILDACSRVDATSYLKRWAAMKGPAIGAIPTGAGTERYYDLIGEDGRYVCSVATFPTPENPLTESSAAWWEKYHGRFGDPAYTSAYSYDAVYILAEAIQRAGATDADALVKALEATDHTGSVSRWVFGEDHHPRYGEGYREIPILQYQEPGPHGFKIVWPPSRKVADFVPVKWDQG